MARDGRTRSLWLAQALDELSAREQTIIKERRLRDDARTLEELGHKLGISKERVRQIEHRALEKLQAPPCCSAPPSPTTSPDSWTFPPRRRISGAWRTSGAPIAAPILIVGGGHSRPAAGAGARPCRPAGDA